MFPPPGESSRRIGDFKGELRAVRWAWKIGDRRGRVRRRYAELLIQWGQYEEARALFESRMKRSPREGKIGLARVAWAERNGEQAIKLLADWAGANPEDLVVRLECARYRALSGDFDSAQEELRRLREAFPERTAEVRLVEAQGLNFSQRREEARNLLESMIAAGESPAQARRMLAQNRLLQYRHEPDPSEIE